MARSGSILGHAVLRTEDPGILRGVTPYFDDVTFPELVHVVFVRSTVAHARLTEVDTSDAVGMPGVVAVYKAGDLDLVDHHGFLMFPTTMNRPPLARDRVRFVGDIVAAVVAETRAEAVDAAEAVIVDYDPLPAVVDLEAAAEDAVLLFEEQGTNVAFGMGTGPVEGVLDDADVVVEARFVNQRVAAVPMEGNGIIAVPGAPDGGLTAWIPSQNPNTTRRELAGDLGLAPEQVRVATFAVGGGFGPKTGVYVEHVIASRAALALGRPVKWTETRSEDMVALYHGRAQVQYVKLGLTRDGIITGLWARILADAGAYPTKGGFLPFFTQAMASAVYAIPKIEVNWQAVVTNTTTTDAYRGAGRPEATQMVERILDMAARRLGIDPAEIRRRNFLRPEQFPYQPPTGAGFIYDTGDYAKALDVVLDKAGYAALRAEQQARRDRGDSRQLGIGVSAYVEVTAPSGLHKEFGALEVLPDGSAVARVGTSAHGQGHATAFAMIVSDRLGIPMDKIRLVQSDTDEIPRGTGTMGSRSLQTAGSAVYRASEEVLAKAKRLAAHLLEAGEDDVVVGDDGLEVVGVPASRLSWAELAQAAADDARRPAGMEAGLAHELDFDGTGSTYPFGAHVAVVEVDTETGRVELVRHVAVDDCGRILNPLLVAGQQHGGIAQGVAQALYEEVRFDADGNPQTGNLMDYAMPSAAELPSFETYNTETPTPYNPLGAKGIGESGTIGATPAVHCAVIDALAPFGVEHIDMPCTAEKVWRAIRGAA